MQSASVCSSDLIFVDIDTGKSITFGERDLVISDERITLSDRQQVEENRRYNITISVSNVIGSTTFDEIISESVIAYQ